MITLVLIIVVSRFLFLKEEEEADIRASRDNIIDFCIEIYIDVKI